MTTEIRKTDHGGTIKNPQRKRRPLPTYAYAHMVFCSSKAVGEKSFKKFESEIADILERFAEKYVIEIRGFACLDKSLHIQLRVNKRLLYPAFVRAISAAIMMKVTGFSRWNKKPSGYQFWDHRPFTRVISLKKDFISLRDPVKLKNFEAEIFKAKD